MKRVADLAGSSADDEHTAPDRQGRATHFAHLALALDDLVAASACLTQANQSDPSQSPQVRQALLNAMVVAYERSFCRSADESRGSSSRYEPEGPLRTAHLHLLGLRNLMRHHGESSSRRVLVGPASGRSTDSHVAPGGRIVWSVRQDPLGPLDLQQVEALFQHLRERLQVEAGQLLADLFVGRATPVHDVVLEDGQR